MGSDSMTKFSEIAYRCLNEDREQRPGMDVVKKELEEALKLEESTEQSDLPADQQVTNVESPPIVGSKVMNVVLVAAECTPWSKIDVSSLDTLSIKEPMHLFDMLHLTKIRRLFSRVQQPKQ
ncbi:hypothetical protein Tco_1534660 [Tanacetum coccineum]